MPSPSRCVCTSLPAPIQLGDPVSRLSLALDPLLGQDVARDAHHAGSPRSEIDMTCIHRQDDFDAEMAAVEASSLGCVLCVSVSLISSVSF